MAFPKYIPTANLPAVSCTVGGVPTPGVIIWGESIPIGKIGVPYSAHVTAAMNSSGNFTQTGFPPGLVISTAGIISGTPTTAGFFNATITLTNATPVAVSRTVTIQINP